MDGPRSLDEAQRGLGDMAVPEFRRAAHEVADMVADYLEGLEALPVLPPIAPGAIRAALPASPPARPEPLGDALSDYLRLVQPNVTQWQHPGFFAYFPSVASAPGILGEWLAASLNSNVMLWRNAPASTELEEVVVSWLRQMLGLPDSFDGMLTDTASISTLTSVVAARQAAGVQARDLGLAGRADLRPLRLYCSAEAHSSVEKAAIVTGLGRAGVRRVPVDAEYRMEPHALARAVEEDRAAGDLPFCVVATAGTTSSSSVDPLGPVADLCEAEGLWLHVDAAYGGAAALAPELRPLLSGWERADSIVVNPHKWMWTPLDASLLLFRRPEVYREAMSLVPDYLRTREEGEAHDYHEYGVQLGRRFRALKLWLVLRYFGAEGMAARIREHCRMARELALWIDREPGWERLAPVPFATVCLRHVPERLAAGAGEPGTEAELDGLNEAVLDRVNRSGRVFLSSTRLGGRFALRVAIGNPRTAERHVALCRELLVEAARELG